MQLLSRKSVVLASMLIMAGAIFFGRGLWNSGPKQTDCPPTQPGTYCVFAGHTDSVTHLAYSADGKFLVSGSWYEGKVRLWETSTWRQIRVLDVYPLTSLGLSPDGKLLITSGCREGHGGLGRCSRGEVKLSEVATGNVVRSFYYKDSVPPAVFSPDGKTWASLACIQWDGDSHCTERELKFRDLRTGSTVHSIYEHGQECGSVAGEFAFSPDGKYLAVDATDNSLQLLDLTTWECVRSFTVQAERPTFITWSNDGKYTASYFCSVIKEVECRGGDLRVWEVASGKLLNKIPAPQDNPFESTIGSASFSPDGKYLAVGAGDSKSTITLWDLTKDEIVFSIKGLFGGVSALTFSPDGRFLISGSLYPGMAIWDAATGNKIRDLSSFPSLSGVSEVLVSPDKRFVAGSGLGKGSIKIWDVATGSPLAAWEAHEGGGVTSIAFSPDGKFLASGSKDMTMKLWAVRTWQLVRTFTDEYSTAVTSIAFSSDGRWLASGYEDGVIRLWEVASGKLHKTFERHTGPVASIVLSPDERWLASSSYAKWLVPSSNDQSIDLWDTQTGQIKKSFNAGQFQYAMNLDYGMNFSSDGVYFVYGSKGTQGTEWIETLKLWNLAKEQEERTIGYLSGAIPFFDPKGIAFSANGRILAAGLCSHGRAPCDKVGFWEVDTGKLLRTIPVNIGDYAFSADGEYLVSTWGKEIRLWYLGPWVAK